MNATIDNSLIVTTRSGKSGTMAKIQGLEIEDIRDLRSRIDSFMQRLELTFTNRDVELTQSLDRLSKEVEALKRRTLSPSRVATKSPPPPKVLKANGRTKAKAKTETGTKAKLKSTANAKSNSDRRKQDERRLLEAMRSAGKAPAVELANKAKLSVNRAAYLLRGFRDRKLAKMEGSTRDAVWTVTK
jgi:hypothetical protein